jgi:hypothetical protein
MATKQEIAIKNGWVKPQNTNIVNTPKPQTPVNAQNNIQLTPKQQIAVKNGWYAKDLNQAQMVAEYTARDKEYFINKDLEAKQKAQENWWDTTKYVGSKIANTFVGAYESVADLGAAGLELAGKATSSLIKGKEGTGNLPKLVSKTGQLIFGKEAGDYKNNVLYQIGNQMRQDKIAEDINTAIDKNLQQKSKIKQDDFSMALINVISNIAATAATGKTLFGNNMANVGNVAKLGTKTATKISSLNKISELVKQPYIKSLFITSTSDAYKEARDKGANDLESASYAVLKGITNTAPELAFGGYGAIAGKGALDDIVIDTVTNVFKSKITNKALELGVSGLAEVGENYIQAAIDPFVNSILSNKLDFSTFKDVTDTNTLTLLSSMILKSTSIPNDIKQNVLQKIEIEKQNITNKPKPTEQPIQQPSVDKTVTQEKSIVDTKQPVQQGTTNVSQDEYQKSLDYLQEEPIIKTEPIVDYENSTLNLKETKELANTISSNYGLKTKNFDEVLMIINDVESGKIRNPRQLAFILEQKFPTTSRKEFVSEEIKNLKKDIRETAIIVDDYIKSQITNYGAFRKRNFGKLRISEKGSRIDGMYNELAEQYPGILSKEVKSESDMLEELARVANIKSYEVIEEDIPADYFEKNSNEIFNTIKEYKQNAKLKYAEKQLGILNVINKTKPIKDTNTFLKEQTEKETRKEKVNSYRTKAKKMVAGIKNWKDKKIGLSYSTNTMERNIRDIIKNKLEADSIIEEYIKPITKTNAIIEKFINEYNAKITKLNLSNNEAIAVQMLGELKYNPETLVTQKQADYFIKKHKLDIQKINSSIEIFRKIYDDLIVRANQVLKEQGYKEIPYRQGYFPHFIEDKATTILGKIASKLGFKQMGGQLPTDIAGITDTFVPGKTWFGNAKRRTGKETDYNAIKGYDNYIRGVADIIFHTENIQKLRALENEIRYQYSDKGVQEEIDKIEEMEIDEESKQEKINGVYEKTSNPIPNLVIQLREYTNGLANKKSSADRSMEQQLGRNSYNVLNNINRRVSSNMVGANISSALTNFIPLTQAYSQVSTKNMSKATLDTIKAIFRDDGFADGSVFLTNRTRQADKLYKTVGDKASDIASLPFEQIDHFTANVIVRGKYYENNEKGMNPQQAMENADQFAKNVITGRDKGSQPTLFAAKNPAIKLFTMFQLEVNNQFGYMFKDLPRDLADEGKKKLASAFFKMFISAFVYNMIKEKITGTKSAFSPVDMAVDLSKNIISKQYGKAFTDIIKEAPLIGNIAGGGRMPISAALPNPLTIATSKNSESLVANLKSELSKPIYYLVPPFGGGQIKKTVEGLSMFNKSVPGSYTKDGKLRFPVEPTILNKIQASIFGQYASKEAKEYFDKNRRPLSKNQLLQLEASTNIKKDYETIMAIRKYKGLLTKYKTAIKLGKDTKSLEKQLEEVFKNIDK